MKYHLPTYDEALHADETDDFETLANATFPFWSDDEYFIERVIEAVRGLLRRSDLSPKQIVTIGRTLHALKRMPLRTAGIGIYISLSIENEYGAKSYDLTLNTDRFAIESSGYIVGACGSDSFSGPTFAVESHCREDELWTSATDHWPDEFSEMTSAKLTVEDYSDDEQTDWDHPDGSAFWCRIEEYHSHD